jgi:hypothetical protein
MRPKSVVETFITTPRLPGVVLGDNTVSPGILYNSARNLSSRLSVFERKDCWNQGKDASFGSKAATLFFQIGNTSHFSLLISTEASCLDDIPLLITEPQ